MAISSSPHTEAVARLPRALAFLHDALPLRLADGELTVALPDPHDDDVLSLLRASTRLRIRPLLMPRQAIRERLRAAYGTVPATAFGRDDAPAVRAVEAVFAEAVAAHASDIHVEPHASGGRVRIRVDGILRELDTIPQPVFPAFCSRLKLLAGMDITDRRLPQDGRYAIPYESRAVDARVSSVPARDGEKLVVRLLDRYAAAPQLGALGMPHDLLERYRAATHAPWGFVVVSGPTGSGKTTTLYASLAELDAGTRNVCAVEDPIEMHLRGITQVQVNVRAGLTFPVVTRAFMRQDPNVIMIGEMRDAETAAVAAAASLAGQIVFTTLHANDAPRTIDRLTELGVTRHSLAAGLSAVVSQRLVRMLCEQCRTRAPIPQDVRAAYAIETDAWYVPIGCATCAGTGYLGRSGVYELMVVDDGTRDAIACGASSVAVAQVAASNGYRPMQHHALLCVLDGRTSFAEATRVVAWRPAR